MADLVPVPARPNPRKASLEQLTASDPTVCAWVAESAG